MRNNIEQKFRLTALAAALAAIYGTALAADDDAKADLAAVAAEVSRLTTPESSISVGIGNWSGNRYQQGIYDGMRDGKAYGMLDITLVKRDNATGTWFTLEGRNLGLDTHELSAEWLRQGNIGLSLDYSRIQRDNPLTFTTGLLGIGTANQVISGTAGANTLPSRDVSLSTKRDLTQLGLYKNLMPNLNLKISFKNEEKNGARQWGLGSNALFLTEPIDSTTQQLEAILEYAGERFQITGGYYGSWYNNEHSLVLGRVNGVTDTTPASGNPASPTSLSLPLDNQAHQLFVNAGYAFTPTTRGTAKLQYGKATQNETLPVAFNVVPLTGSPTNLDGRIDTSLAEVGLTSRPLPKLSLVANLRYYDVKDKTPVARIISTTTSGTTTDVYNTPHSYTKKSGKFEANYRLPQQFSLIGGIDINNQDRSVPTQSTVSTTGGVATITYSVPFRLKLDETTYRLQLRRTLSDTLNGSLAYLNSDRRGPGYVPSGNNPASNSADLVNPTHISDRKRDKWRAMLDWSPTARLSFQFAVDQAQDKYGPTNRPYGLVDGSADIYTVDVNYTVNDNWQVSGWYSRDDTKAREVGALLPINPANTRDAQLREKGDSFGFGMRGRPSGKLEIGANLEWVKSVSQYPQTLNGAYTPTTAQTTLTPTFVGLVPLSDITNKLTRLKLFGDYAVDKKSSVRIEMIHERWKTDDWTWSFSDGSPFIYGGPSVSGNPPNANVLATDGTVVTAKPIQSVTFVGARYIYKFQ